MAAVNPPWVIQASSHPADVFRRQSRFLAQGAQGVRSYISADLQVTPNGSPNMTVNVAAGEALINGTQNTTSQGAYECLNDATVNLAIAASDPTNPRIDIVVAQVQDAVYSGSTNAWSLAIVTGTPAPSPSPPATPANAIVLAQVAVAANATSITSGNITDTRPKFAIGNVPFKLDDQSPTGSSLVIPASGVLPSTGWKARITWYGRTTSGNTADVLNLTFNGDVAGNYDWTVTTLSGNAAPGGATALANGAIRVGVLPGGGAGAGLFNAGWIEINGYAISTTRRALLNQCWRNDSAANNMDIGAGAWRNTANAITTITLTPAAGNFASGSRVTTEIE